MDNSFDFTTNVVPSMRCEKFDHGVCVLRAIAFQQRLTNIGPMSIFCPSHTNLLFMYFFYTSIHDIVCIRNVSTQFQTSNIFKTNIDSSLGELVLFVVRTNVDLINRKIND